MLEPVALGVVHDVEQRLKLAPLIGIERLQDPVLPQLDADDLRFRVLGDAAESSFRQSMLISQGDLTVFFSNWLVGSLTGLALFALFWPLISAALARLRGS